MRDLSKKESPDYSGLGLPTIDSQYHSPESPQQTAVHWLIPVPLRRKFDIINNHRSPSTPPQPSPPPASPPPKTPEQLWGAFSELVKDHKDQERNINKTFQALRREFCAPMQQSNQSNTRRYPSHQAPHSRLISEAVRPQRISPRTV